MDPCKHQYTEQNNTVEVVGFTGDKTVTLDRVHKTIRSIDKSF